MRTLTRRRKNGASAATRQASRAHAAWVRQHPRIDDSAFPEYPDEKTRRGASRGALPNGNPWYPESDAELPGPRWSRRSEPAPSASPRPGETRRSRKVVAPPSAASRVSVIGGAPTHAERRIAEDIEQRLAQSKKLDGRCVEIHVHGEDVFLRGRLPTLEAKVEAGMIASTIRGVMRVHNQIRLVARH